MRNAFVETLFSLAAQNRNIVLVTGDLGFGVLTRFWETYPDQFVNAGICEQNMTALAAGMALEGKTVFTYSIANFPTLRCLEQIRNDVAYHRANVKIVSVGGGFSYGAMGMTHHGTEDISMLRALPDMTVYTPSDPTEACHVTRWAASLAGPCYIRLGRGGERELPHIAPNMESGKANLLRTGKDTVLFTFGAIAEEALGAADILENEHGVSCAVYSFPTVKPLDDDTVLRASRAVEHVFSLEEHTVVGGAGGAIAELLSGSPCQAMLHRLGIPDTFCSAVGSQQYLRIYCSIDRFSIAQRILDALSQK